MATRRIFIPFTPTGIITRPRYRLAVLATGIVSGHFAAKLLKSKMPASRDRVPDQHER
jgi:hypothetical protein